jgi:hypothetical protein
VSDEDIPASGSRWEPATEDLTTPVADVGLVLAGGVSGVAIGHPAAGDGVSDGTVSDQNGEPGDGPGGRPEFRDGATA